MNPQGDIQQRMEYIRHCFLRAAEYAEQNTDTGELPAYLDNEPPKYRSIAYEGASMGIGSRDIQNNDTGLSRWSAFRESAAKQHLFHADIGLGWAYAKAGILSTDLFKPACQFIETMLFDGIGYYHGLFKGRSTVKNQQVPEGLPSAQRGSFDQGLGRRLWYLAEGDCQRLAGYMNPFAQDRRQDLWRGVGIACGYVGGCIPGVLETLLSMAGEAAPAFRAGIRLAVISRVNSGSTDAETEAICQHACNMSIGELMADKALITGIFV